MADTPDTLIDEHIALLAEARRERDYFMQNAADLAKALSAEQALNAELVAALKVLLADVQDLLGVIDTEPSDPLSEQPSIKNARAAIARAESQQ